MKQFPKVIFFIGLYALAAAQFAPAADLDTRFFYRLTNNFLGPGSSLTVVDIGGTRRLEMTRTSQNSAQIWKFVNRGGGKYAIRSAALGNAFSLDVINDGRNDKLYLAKTGNYSGQLWTVGSWGDGTYELSNDFTGFEKVLDTYSDTHEPFLNPHRDHSGQHWRLIKVREQEAQGSPREPLFG
jgi:Ricin-type beta-trefoil lectin domain-like